jgi:dolichol-phosphate mannosyltransferase
MPELAIIVPTFNERDNVAPLAAALATALAGIDYEVVFVDDDSPDGTADEVATLAAAGAPVRLIRRIGRRGLASAVVEGMLSSLAPYFAVLDADMQHDESVLPVMLARLESEPLDLVVGTRHKAGGSMGDFSPSRVALSRAGRRLSAFVCRADLSDPMSGFFMLTRSFFLEVVRRLSTVGFKILLDLVASSRRPVRIAEVGYTFRGRARGESKLDPLVGLEYLELLADKSVGRWIPVRYSLFALVGAFGVVAQLVLIRLMMGAAGLDFPQSQLLSSVVVIVLNFALNNLLTFRSRRLRGLRWFVGLLLFSAACSIGLFSNLRIADRLYAYGLGWPLSSSLGIVVGSVWNYFVSSILVWRVRRSE